MFLITRNVTINRETDYLFGAHEFTSGFKWVRIA